MYSELQWVFLLSDLQAREKVGDCTKTLSDLLSIFVSNSTAEAAHLPHCHRNHSNQCHSDLGLWQPRIGVLLCDPIPRQTVWQRLPGSRWSSHHPIQHRWPQPIFRIWVSRHGCQQCWPGAIQRYCGNPYKWASTLITSSSCPGANAELQHHVGPVGTSRGAQRSNTRIPGLL